ncbi:hypothetical protein [Vallitalea okinawensis]|uniref:hypothetical protein n=1 Tax=Vallitalea okinawensis TaxID=2078660 RepID=UPI000CFC559B|nr:hypothetical protein [Vallitalea okinawensis]
MLKIRNVIFICIMLILTFYASTEIQTDVSRNNTELRHIEILSVEAVDNEIIGEWKLISYEDSNGIIDYTAEDRIWTFDGEKFIVDSYEFGGALEGSYEVRRAYLISDLTVVLKSGALEGTHMYSGKFIFKSLADDILTFGDWNNSLEYKLKLKR